MILDTKEVRCENPANFTMLDCEVAGGSLRGLTTLPLVGTATFKYSTRATSLRGLSFTLDHVFGEPLETYGPNYNIYASFLVNGTETWFDGVNWVPNNNTYLEAHPLVGLFGLEDLDDVLPLLIKNPSDLSIKFYFVNSDPLLKSPALSSFKLIYENSIFEPEEIQMCNVYGYIKSPDNKPIVGATILIRCDSAKNDYIESANRMVNGAIVLTSDVNGRWATPLMPTSNYEGAGSGKYKISVFLANSSQYNNFYVKYLNMKDILFEVPDTVEENITSLIAKT